MATTNEYNKETVKAYLENLLSEISKDDVLISEVSCQEGIDIVKHGNEKLTKNVDLKIRFSKTIL